MADQRLDRPPFIPRLPALGLACLLVGALGLAPRTAAAQDQIKPQTNTGPGISQSEELSQPNAITPAPAAPAHLFGDWGGIRTYLGNLGIGLTFDYTTETAWAFNGGLRRGADYAHQFALQADIDWEKLVGLRGFSTHAIFVERAGRNTSTDYIGDNVLQAQEVYGAGFDMAVHLYVLYAEEELANGRVDIAAGRLAVGLEFAASPLYCNYMSLSICGHPRALSSEAGFTDWPQASWGGRIRVRPTTDTYIQTGLYETKPFPAGGRSGFDWSTTTATGETFPIEFGYEPAFGRDRLPGHYKAGFVFDNSTYQDFYSDANGQPYLLTGNSPRNRKGRAQYYFLVDQMLMRNGPGQNDGLIVLGAYSFSDGNTSVINQLVFAGLIDRGFWKARPNDQFNLGFTWYEVSNSLSRAQGLDQVLGLPLAEGAYGVQGTAYVVEASYNLPVYRGIQMQPEFEYFIRPGGARAVPNAAVLGLKTHVLF